ncbi:hypothetical protein [Clostridium kluyveri]|uniref:YqzN/YkzM domain-containing protein n=1 Tax=Clostridium kluyveri TaxID=1534 RepID=A0A1L5F2Y7_CLOKL|nr:hypothetical protein [Clostridium kluyveri]APM37365.1 hypothetical protein BS101_00575 [Clostridium kluyveri]
MADTEVKNNDTEKETVNSTVSSDTKTSSISSKDLTPVISVNNVIEDRRSTIPSTTININIPRQEIKYSVEELIKNSKALTGHKREVAVGALFDCQEKELTKDDFKKAIEVFLKRKVK